MRRSTNPFALIGTILVAATVASAGEVRVSTSRVAGETVLLADDGTGSTELRRTGAFVEVVASGSDPLDQASFVVWSEDGRRFSAIRRGAEGAWSTARPLRTSIALRDGLSEPGEPLPEPAPALAAGPLSRLHIVQFRTISIPEWRRALESLGVVVLAHVPHNGHVVRVDAERVPDIRALEFVERVEPYHPSYRIASELRAELIAGPAASGERRLRVAVFEWGAAAKERVVAAAAALGARTADSWSSGHVVEVWADGPAALALANHDDVMWIERWTPSSADMDVVRQNSGTAEMHDRLGLCGTGVRGEVLDTGIEADHPDFDGILLHGPTGVDGHGTSTYGIVFGNGDGDGDGDGRAVGQLPCAQGIFADLSELTDRFAHTQELKQAPYFASFQSNSWGGAPTTSYTTLSHQIDDIVWRLDIAILNSQSNNGNQSSRPEAWGKNVISVGGIFHYETLDTADDAWDFGASVGPAADGRIKPDVSYWYDSIFTTDIGGYRSDFGGTSAATPESAGVLGAIVELWANNAWNTDPAGATVFDKLPHFSTLKALLVNSASQYPFTGANADLGRFRQGWGRPNARTAYERSWTSFVVDESDVLAASDVATYQIDVPDGAGELRVTMVYPDPPGTLSSSVHRINDLDVRVVSPSAITYHGNVGLEDATVSSPGGAPDAINTVENVYVAAPEPGTWTVEVEAAEINQDAHLQTPDTDDAAFALVVTGGRAIPDGGAGRLAVRPGRSACEGLVAVSVVDGNAGGVTLAVSSTTEPAGEEIDLAATNPGSGIFTGQVVLVDSPPTADGAISVADGDVVTIEYVDVDDGSGSGAIRLESVEVDCASPVIGAVAVSDVTDTGATVSWTTDEEANSSVGWGTSLPPTGSERRSGAVTQHFVRLNGLAACTSYFVAVVSEDRVGNVATDDNGGSHYLFTTLARTDGELHDCREGTLVLEAERVGCGGTVPIRLTDADADLDPAVPDTVTIGLSSATETSGEAVTLVETGPSSGVFSGSLQTGSGAPAADGVLQVSDGDWVTGTYFDPDDGTGVGGVSASTIDADCAGPLVDQLSVSALTDAMATVSWSTSEPAVGLVEWGPTPALGFVAASPGAGTGHSAEIGPFTSCERVYFRVVATDPFGNTALADAGGVPFAINALGVPGIYYSDDFESDAGWSLAGEWEIGAPQGLGTAPGDPSSALSGTGVLGHDLSGLGSEPGDYEPGSSESAVGPPIDASGFAATELRFKRRLNVVNGSFAYLDARDQNGSWVLLFQTPIQGVQDTQWVDVVLDVSSHADGNPQFQLRFRERSILASSHASGWNVDDLVLRDGAQPALGECGGCSGAPTFAGLLSATDEDPCADSGVRLRWAPAPGWGTGGGGSYAIYRGSSPEFEPGPSTLIASGVNAVEWVDPSVPNDQDVFYLVRAENDELCASGPANGGVTDGNGVVVAARDATFQSPPPDLGATLAVGPIADAHARLSWSAAPGAAGYRVLRAPSPGAALEVRAEGAATTFDDRDVLLDASPHYYVVRAVDACGNEGP